MAINKAKTDNNNLDGNIDLGFSTKKKRFSVGGDPNVVIEFDPSDLGVANRLSKALPKFKELEDEWKDLNAEAESLETTNIEDEQGAETAKTTIESISIKLDKLEKDVRDLLDNVFDSAVADKLLGNSSAFSPVNGYLKYEHIITAMLKCFEQHVQDEAPKFNARKVTQKYTHKYIKK